MYRTEPNYYYYFKILQIISIIVTYCNPNQQSDTMGLWLYKVRNLCLGSKIYLKLVSYSSILFEIILNIQCNSFRKIDILFLLSCTYICYLAYRYYGTMIILFYFENFLPLLSSDGTWNIITFICTIQHFIKHSLFSCVTPKLYT